jgi:hypothetical protein
MKPVILYRDFEFRENPEELAAMKQHFACYANRAAIPSGSLVVGRYSVLPFYKELEEDLAALGSLLINTYQQHCYVADLWNWYHDLQEFTPKTWSRASDVPLDQPGSFFLKGATNSKKHNWNSHAFASSRKDVGRILVNLQNDGLVGTQNIYVRQFVPLKTYCIGINDMPITEEYRFFIFGGRILSGGFYWSSHTEELADMGIRPDVTAVPTDFLDKVIGLVGDKIRFWVLDVARTVTGEWIVVELNDGCQSGLSDNDPNTLYANMAKAMEI